MELIKKPRLNAEVDREKLALLKAHLTRRSMTIIQWADRMMDLTLAGEVDV